MVGPDIPHPGIIIRAQVLPAGLSVTKAAQQMGVSRPALSNLLNGNAALSPDMAARLEKAFKHPRSALMEMQARYDAAQATTKEAPANALTYVPPFLATKANDIEKWASHNIRARSRFAVFLRTLIHSTSSALTKVDFPGNDDAERPGWDGFVEAPDKGNPWIPAGNSGWEFGTNEDPKAKADNDFQKSVKALGKKERASITFVFVTPRRWSGKDAWVKAQQAKKLWKDVRAYDSSNLEQWVEQSLPGQAWFANETNVPAEHVRSLDKCWTDWAGAPPSPLTGALFTSAIEAAKRTIRARLSKPADGPIAVAADSTEEGLAFLAQLLSEKGGDGLAEHRDRVLVFDQPGVLPRLASAAQTFIPVAFTREVERELEPYAKAMHSFVVYPRNVPRQAPDIVLEPVSYETFSRALEAAGKDRDEITQLANASGRSLTVLRRQLSKVEAVRTPNWATDHKTAASLVPYLFVGAWNSHNPADRFGLSVMASDRAYDDLEKELQSLTQLNDSPVWSIGSYRGVISKIDLLYAIAGVITAADLRRYFDLARLVLDEDDPALDLQESERWAAAIHGKKREFSKEFRDGISETLVLLAVHGQRLFDRRLGIDTEGEVRRVVRELLRDPLTTRVLEAHDHDLPTYAEAAPAEFLSIIERDLKSNDPAVFGLMRPADAGVLGSSPSRTGLLWALEGLSWNPDTLPQASLILAKLAEIEIKDNWVNKPANSLDSIFRAWMPQTSADHRERVDVIKKIAEKHPRVAWRICISQFDRHSQVGTYSHKPRWRPDGFGFGEPYRTRGPVIEFVREMIEMALSWKDHSLEMLCDLVDRLEVLAGADQTHIWTLIEAWAGKANDADKAVMREKIRITLLSRRAARRSKKAGAPKSDLEAAAKAAHHALEPSDLFNRHGWLFKDSWIEESADEIEDDGLDYAKREERIKNLRSEALRDIHSQRGLAGLLGFSKQGNASGTIGALLATEVLTQEELGELLPPALTAALADNDDARTFRGLISGVLHSLADDSVRQSLIKSITSNLSEEEIARFLMLAPFRKSTWTIVDGESEATKANYWREVAPDWIHSSDIENVEAVERLLKADRPRAAFSCIRLVLEKTESQLIFRVLTAASQGGSDQPGHYMLDEYHIEKAFKHLNGDAALTLEQKAVLEFAYLDALARPWDMRDGAYGIPNLERYIEDHPELFAQAVAWTYKRSDGAADPGEFEVSSDRRQYMAERGYKLLDALKRVPGHNNLGELNAGHLTKWLGTVRQLLRELGRAEVGDICIGHLLSSAPIGADGVWPCEPVREVMEEIQSDEIMRGAQTEAYNSRGPVWRGEGGDQERELAEKYRKWAQALQISHPFVSSTLLMGLVRTYDHEASSYDTEAGIRRRLR